VVVTGGVGGDLQGVGWLTREELKWNADSRLRKKGFTNAGLARLTGPIGLKSISGKTPMEAAVAAEFTGAAPPHGGRIAELRCGRCAAQLTRFRTGQLQPGAGKRQNNHSLYFNGLGNFGFSTCFQIMIYATFNPTA